MSDTSVSKSALAKRHQLSADYISARFYATKPSQSYIRRDLIIEADEAELSAEFINQLENDNE